MNYEAVVGLEIHIQAKTKSKMFSSVSADYFGKAPNSCVDPVSLGLPGALPVPNKKAIEHCLRLSLALNCQINQETKFDRKNYFYPDLPKGYQISQYDQPIGFDGFLPVESKAGGARKIRIRRVHMEEDTGKSIHEDTRTLLDFNKAGVPLIEVVTEPDFLNSEEIDFFAKRLRQIVRYLGVSDADMEKGQMRYELNISLRQKGEEGYPPYKVEVKNIGSISLLQKVLAYEFKRQSELLAKGETPVQETRGTRDMTGKTYSQRVKEEADDYRYFPEPDIPPLHFTDEYIAELKASLPALPEEVKQDLIKAGVANETAETIIGSIPKVKFIETYRDQPKVLPEIAKLLVGELTVLKQNSKRNWGDLITNPKLLVKLIELKQAGQINSNTQKALLTMLVEAKFSTLGELQSYIEAKNLLIKSDSNELTALATEIIAADPTAKERYAKNPKIVMFFVGQLMKATKGSANPQVAAELVEKILQSL